MMQAENREMKNKSRSRLALFRIRRSSVYQSLSASPLGGLYRKLKGEQRLVEDRAKEAAFYGTLLQGFHRGDLVFDIGANTGEKVEAFVRIGARVVAVEPDETNLKRLRTRFSRLQETGTPVSIIDAAVSDREGSATMLVDGPGSALNTLSEKWVDALKLHKERFAHTTDLLEFDGVKSVKTTTLDRLIEDNGAPFFVKIDVEGYELKVLQGLHRSVPYLSFEVNLPEFREEGLQCIDLLRGLREDGEFNYTSDCRSGLLSSRWLDSQKIAQVLTECDETCIEIFWRSNV